MKLRVFIIKVAFSGSHPEPQRKSFPGGAKVDAGPPKLSEEQKKRSSLSQRQKRKLGRKKKIFAPKLNATASTLPHPLSPGPARSGPGYDVPPEPVLGRLEYESGLESDSRPLFKDSDSYSDSCPRHSDSDSWNLKGLRLGLVIFVECLIVMSCYRATIYQQNVNVTSNLAGRDFLPKSK